MTGCTSKIETQFRPSSKGLLKRWFSSSRWGSTVIHRSHLTGPNQEFANLQDVFAITTTKNEFNAAVDALNAAGIACHSPALPKRPKATTNRVSKRLILEVQDILEVERQRDDKRRRVDVTAVPRRGLWVTPPSL